MRTEDVLAAVDTGAGRGLLLIQQLADAWGVDPHGDGKSIWFELSESPAAR